MIGAELIDVKCPRCEIETAGSSAKASVIGELVGFMPPGIDADEIVFYVVCPRCMAIILPSIFDPLKK